MEGRLEVRAYMGVSLVRQDLQLGVELKFEVEVLLAGMKLPELKSE